ncbi:VCBS repeat-containing protein [Maribacter sp. HTCC2170]|uniref:VCBS repeat-containing protein n=1 Tax=Maribacter sp. (strain HTCC2170 / KCCM 42371) TaxID=313603 RepID=UPI00006BE0CF|nr:VCBS repeat-containing protein [Maribacter sp. HTCC2170]EAQ99982.1 hypothetical protein FB2170_01372 [Maribacter sp. HTCC2170]
MLKQIPQFFSLCILLVGCNNSNYKVLNHLDEKDSINDTQFSLIPVSQSSIDFNNKIEETEALNFLNFSNIYNGGGVATADFNNDGLVDVFFVANQLSNKLYLNKGEFKFEDVTTGSGLEDVEGWSTGVSVIDINNDGWLDIYVCKSGEIENSALRENKLFVNQKNNTFKEEAEKWKVNDPGFSTQAYFFDFDKDGDLDMYLVNHRIDFENTSRLNMQIERAFNRLNSDILYRNDGDFFTEITHEAGMVNKAWGLSASIGDFNNDNWPDVYVCNDFLTPDMLYINNKNGTFSNQILDRINHISYSSMGSDFADINNDLLPDLMVLEMANDDHKQSKQNMATMSTGNFKALVEKKYHYQYMVNTLQLNKGNGQFSEIGQLSGLAKTNWSWAPLITDFDNDGFKDVFVTNGILKEMGNQDFRIELSKRFAQKNKPDFNEVSSMMPSFKINNYSFKNNGDYTFTNTSKKWGFDVKTQSNGVAYADFNNDGNLDLVINNINSTAQVYKNNESNNFIQIRLEGDIKNTLAIGSKVTINVKGKKQYQELYLSRGFLSSVQNVMNFGVGDASMIDEILVEWPNQMVTKIENIEVNQVIKVEQKNAIASIEKDKSEEKTLLTEMNSEKRGISFKHAEKDIDDFKKQVLLPHSQSHNGPFIDKADVNNDGLEDFFVGGAAGQSAELYVQTNDGNFKKQISSTWENDRAHEDLGVLFFDADGDEDQDLYVVSGSSEFSEGDSLFQDRLYVNNGEGEFAKSVNSLPLINSSGQTVKASDMDNDGDMDLFVGGRIIPDKYPYAPKSYILINEGGRFIDKTKTIAPEIANIGMVTDAIFSDFDHDSDEDLILVGEWMPITILENNEGIFQSKTIESLKNTTGIWFSVASHDIDNDGDIDYFAGNLGLNAKYRANKKKELHIFCDDFDGTGTYDIVLSKNYKGSLVPARGRECSSQQMPFVLDKFPNFKMFAEADLYDIYGEDKLSNALHYQADLLESIYLENLGNGEFKLRILPNTVQIAPIMDFKFIDLDNDELDEIIIVGNHYDSEVETVRYDASYGSILSYQKDEFVYRQFTETGFFNNGNAKDMGTVKTKNEDLIIVTNNNAGLRTFSLDASL